MNSYDSRCFAIAAVLAVCLQATSTNAQMGAQRKLEARQLVHLTTSVICEQYCRTSDPEIDVLLLELQLRFTAVGTTPVILLRKSTIVPCVMIARAANDLDERKFEAHWCSDVVITRDGVLPIGTKPDESFVVIPPGGHYDTTAEISVLVSQGAPLTESPRALGPGEHVGSFSITIDVEAAMPPAPSDSVFVGRSAQPDRVEPPVAVQDQIQKGTAVATEVTRGDHYLRVLVLTWDAPGNPAKYREAWKTTGDLWPYGLDSQPMRFNVAGAGRSQDCP